MALRWQGEKYRRLHNVTRSRLLKRVILARQKLGSVAIDQGSLRIDDLHLGSTLYWKHADLDTNMKECAAAIWQRWQLAHVDREYDVLTIFRDYFGVHPIDLRSGKRNFLLVRCRMILIAIMYVICETNRVRACRIVNRDIIAIYAALEHYGQFMRDIKDEIKNSGVS